MSYLTLSSVIHSRTWLDYLRLTKPKVVALLVLTAWVGMVLASDKLPDFYHFFYGSIGIALLSASAAAFNHILDQKVDAQMARTYMRPLPKGRLSTQQALRFAIGIGGLGFVCLWFGVNHLSAWLTLASLVGYAVIYTLLLKRATPQNIVVGGLAGAMPPLLGWVAMTGHVEANALLLVMIIFTWTPPHFWALAIHRCDDYAKVNIPMLPVTHGIAFTKSLVLLYTLLLAAVSLLPYLTAMSGMFYFMVCLYLNMRFIHFALALKYDPKPDSAMAMFHYSISYLLWLFVALLVDHYSHFLVFPGSTL